MLVEWGSVVPGAVAGSAVLGLLFVRGRARLELSRAKHRSLTGHARWSRRVAKLVPFYEYDEDRFFRCDDAPAEIQARRRAGFARLTQLYRERFPQTAEAAAQARESVSDLRFTSSYRVPFQFSARVRQALPAGSFVQSAQGVTLTDLDGNSFYDLTGSYGVNLFGHDFYKACMRDGAAVPVQVANLSSIWTVLYTAPSRYNWMLQYYLRAEGLALSWVGTGRLIFSLDYDDAAFAIVAERFVAACRAMADDGWWSALAVTNKAIKRQLLRELAVAAMRRPRPVRSAAVQ